MYWFNLVQSFLNKGQDINLGTMSSKLEAMSSKEATIPQFEAYTRYSEVDDEKKIKRISLCIFNGSFFNFSKGAF